MEEEEKDAKAGEDSGTYELDLSGDEDSQVDDVMRDALEAVAAVERKHKKKTSREDVDLSTEIEIEEKGEASAAESPAASAEAEELRARLMRTLADFDNFRKRSDKEREDFKRYAVVDTLKDFLGVTDNLERALASSGSVEELKKGVDMILRQQADMLKRWGVVPVPAVGEPFDPSVHEAVAREDSAEVDVPTVTGELQRGYKIHDRLLRPAMVTVAMPLPDKPDAN